MISIYPNAMTPVTPSSPQSELLELQASIYREARSSGRPVKQLMTWLLDRRNLQAAWDRIQSSDGANTPGLDGVTVAQIGARSVSWLAKLADDLYHRSYRPMSPRWIEVPKPRKPGKFRKIGILCIRDRVVQAAAKQILEPIAEPVFLDGSFGFRPGRSVAGALGSALRLLSDQSHQSARFSAVAQLDIADCFDTIDHQLLLEEVARHVADLDVLALLEQILQAGGQQIGRLWWKRTCVIVRGSSRSPLLCNLALHPLDQALHDFGQAAQDGLRLLRYADDLLLIGRDSKLTDRGIALTRQILQRMQQKLGSGSESAIPIERGVNWLGVRIQPRPNAWLGYTTCGYVIPDEKVIQMLERLTEMTTPPNEKIDGSAFNLSRWIVSINEQLRDWRQAYLYADNAPDVFRALDEHTSNRLASLLQSVTGARWSQLQNQYRVRLPRGFQTWEYQGSRLTVLSSLAPHAPARLTRKPAWMSHNPKKQQTSEPEPMLALPSPEQIQEEAKPEVPTQETKDQS